MLQFIVQYQFAIFAVKLIFRISDGTVRFHFQSSYYESGKNKNLEEIEAILVVLFA